MNYSLSKLAAILLALSAVLHLIAAPLSGWTSIGLILVPVGLLYALMANGLMRERRWLAYVVLPLMLGGAIICYASLGSVVTAALPDALLIAIAVADIGCALALFVVLWRDPTASHA